MKTHDRLKIHSLLVSYTMIKRWSDFHMKLIESERSFCIWSLIILSKWNGLLFKGLLKNISYL